MRHFSILFLPWAFLSICLSACKPSSSSPQTIEKQHFFSVDWGCVEYSKNALEAAGISIRDYSAQKGSCPSKIAVLDEQASALFSCSFDRSSSRGQLCLVR